MTGCPVPNPAARPAKNRLLSPMSAPSLVPADAVERPDVEAVIHVELFDQAVVSAELFDRAKEGAKQLETRKFIVGELAPDPVTAT